MYIEPSLELNIIHLFGEPQVAPETLLHGGVTLL